MPTPNRSFFKNVGCLCVVSLSSGVTWPSVLCTCFCFLLLSFALLDAFLSFVASNLVVRGCGIDLGSFGWCRVAPPILLLLHPFGYLAPALFHHVGNGS